MRKTLLCFSSMISSYFCSFLIIVQSLLPLSCVSTFAVVLFSYVFIRLSWSIFPVSVGIAVKSVENGHLWEFVWLSVELSPIIFTVCVVEVRNVSFFRNIEHGLRMFGLLRINCFLSCIKLFIIVGRAVRK